MNSLAEDPKLSHHFNDACFLIDRLASYCFLFHFVSNMDSYIEVTKVIDCANIA